MSIRIEPDRILIRLEDNLSHFSESLVEIDTNYFRSVFARKVIFH